MKIKWTEEKIKILKENYANSSWDILCEKLGTNNRKAIMTKAYKLKIKRSHIKEYNTKDCVGSHKPFSKQEDEYIVSNYKTMTAQSIACNLNRKYYSITQRLRILGIKKEAWTKEDILLLKKVYPKYPSHYVREKYFPHKNTDQIIARAVKLKISKTEKPNIRWYSKVDMVEKYKQLAKTLKRTPTISDIDSIDDMPSSKTYERYFGKLSTLAIQCGMKPNLILYSRGISTISSNGDKCDSNAEYIITEYMIHNNINYLKGVRYSDYINDEMCNTKTCDWVVGNVFIEYFGLPNKKEYYKKMQIKRKLLKDNNIVLIELFRKDLQKLDEKLKNLSQ